MSDTNVRISSLQHDFRITREKVQKLRFEKGYVDRGVLYGLLSGVGVVSAGTIGLGVLNKVKNLGMSRKEFALASSLAMCILGMTGIGVGIGVGKIMEKLNPEEHQNYMIEKEKYMKELKNINNELEKLGASRMSYGDA